MSDMGIFHQLTIMAGARGWPPALTDRRQICLQQTFKPSSVQVVITTLGVAMPVQLDHDGKWRANVLFDAAGLTTLSYYFVINGQPPRHKLQSFIRDRNTPSKASTSPLKRGKTVTYVSVTICHLCVRPFTNNL